MHYKNGREAKNGDKVMWLPNPQFGAVVVGILYNATAGNDYCNGALARLGPGDSTPNLKECLRLDDALQAIELCEAALNPTGNREQCPACAGQNVPHTIECSLPEASAAAK